MRNTPSRSPSEDWKMAPEHALLFFGASIFLTILAPFGTDSDLTFPSRLIYWFSVVFGGTAIALAFSNQFQRHARTQGKLGYGLVTLVQILAVSVPITLLVGGVEMWLRHPIRWTQLPLLYPYVLSIVAAITLASLFVRRHRALSAQVTQDQTASISRADSNESTVSTTFHRRLEPHLRHEAITFLRAEDHYLHVHTSHGTAVVRCNLSVAVDELGSANGQQVHRSFWVARSAIRSVKRHGNSYRLVMTDGKTIPLSRRRYRELTKCNWLPV